MRNLICTNGETCWAEECCKAGFCMHAEEMTSLQRDIEEEDPAPGENPADGF